MGIFDGLLLGFVQGITEFVPISSTGHLILVRDIFGISLSGSLAFDAVLHLATALAVLIYFRKDVWALLKKPRENKTLWFALVLGTIPAVLVGLGFESFIENVLRGSGVVAWGLIAGSLIFILAEWSGSQAKKLTGGKGFLVGLYQAMALVPGLSRSGATISGGLFFGLKREAAARFAFLLSFPVLLGVGILKLFEIGESGFSDGVGVSLVVGSATAFLVGMGAIHFMIRFLKHHTLYPFVVYRLLLAGTVFLFLV